MNLPDFIPSYLVFVIMIVAIVAGALLLALIVFLIVKSVKNSNKISKYVKSLLFKTKFTYELCTKESNQFHDFIKITYSCLDYYLTYHFYVTKSDNYLATAKKEVNRLIKDNTLTNHTLNIISKQEFEQYAC